MRLFYLNMNKIKKIAEVVVVTVVFAGLLWQALAPRIVSQGWGGDYAGYISQARNVVLGLPQNQSFYLYNPGNPYLAPPAYPMGFALALAPFVSVDKVDIPTLCRVVGLHWFLLGLIFYFFMRRFTNWPFALCTMLMLLFNPYIFEIKRSILPDLLFTSLSLTTLYAYIFTDRSRWRNVFLIGILLFLTCLTRYNGVTLVLCLALDQFLRLVLPWIKSRRLSKPVSEQYKIWGACAASMVLLLVLNKFLFQMPVHGSYLDQYSHDLWNTFHANLNEVFKNLNQYYFLEPSMFFYGIQHHDDAAILGGAFAVTACTIGLFISGHEASMTLRIYLLCFLLLLIVWPQAQGMRYQIPVFTVLWFFGALAVERLPAKGRVYDILKWIAIPVLLWGAYERIDRKVYRRMTEEDSGAPEHAINQAAFQYVCDSLPPDARFAFHQPLVFGLYAKRPAMRWRNFLNEDQVYRELKEYKVDYLMVNSWVDQDNGSLKSLLANSNGHLEKVWANERNTIFKIK